MPHWSTQRSLHRQVAKIAIPMVMANLSVPLLGLVDTAVMGHLSQVHYLAGVAIGSMVISLLFWLAGFLRMSTTGATAQAKGRNDHQAQAHILLQGLVLALVLGCVLALLQWPIWQVAKSFIQASPEVAEQGKIYVQIRILAAPASLMNLVLMGWLIGRQQSGAVMRLMLICNVLNIILDLLFVVGLDGKTAGAAWATWVADYVTLLLALRLCWQQLPDIKKQLTQFKGWATPRLMRPLLAMNRDIFLRSLALQLCLAFMTAQAARLGDNTVAANAVLMNFMLLISYGLDGIAYAAEAMVGEAYGAKSRQRVLLAVKVNALWSYILAAFFALSFYLAGIPLIELLTDLPEVRAVASNYLTYVIWLPVLGAGCFLLDGVFIGLTAAKAMRNTMLVSALCVFFPVWWFNQDAGNHALWWALLSFLTARGVTLLWCLRPYLILPKMEQTADQ